MGMFSLLSLVDVSEYSLKMLVVVSLHPDLDDDCRLGNLKEAFLFEKNKKTGCQITPDECGY